MLEAILLAASAVDAQGGTALPPPATEDFVNSPPLPNPPIRQIQPNKAATPKLSPQDWVRYEDYPALERRDRVEGTTGIVLTVDIRGRVSDCRISRSSGSNVLDVATCIHVVRRGRFDPATDKNGDAITGAYSLSVRWTVPLAPLSNEYTGPPLKVSKYIPQVDKDGSIIGCQVELVGGNGGAAMNFVGDKICAEYSNPREAAGAGSAKATGPVPIGSPANWIAGQESDIISASVGDLSIDATVEVILHIDVAGRATNCKVLVSSGRVQLDQWFCYTLVRRSRFLPARDASGRSIEGRWVGKMRWTSPKG